MGVILLDIKKMLGIDESYTVFDTEIVIHINSAFSTLEQVGVPFPNSGFAIVDSTETWESAISSDVNFNNVKTYVYLKVKTMWDPPTNAFVMTAMEKQIEELVWRINVYSESGTVSGTV